MLQLSTDKLTARIENGVGWVTFNRPERHNAVSLDMWQALGDAIDRFEADPDVRVVVLTGAGGKAFAAGADISEFGSQRANDAQRKHYGQVSSRSFKALSGCSKPVIAAIRGYCIGGGLLIAMAADVRFATEASRFGVPAAKLGLGYDYAGVASLARLVGPASAADILFSARQLEADEALRIGLVNFVVDDDDLEHRIAEYTARIVDNAPLTIHAIKASLGVLSGYTKLPGRDEVEALVARCYESDDYREGRTAFMEKRKPVFKGR
ncbi:MAG: enoyl-CoA hydratase [Polyangiales bacterium]